MLSIGFAYGALTWYYVHKAFYLDVMQAAGVSSRSRGHFSRCLQTAEEISVFDKTKQRINTELNDRVTAPVKTAVILSAIAVTLALVALLIAATKAAS